MELKNDKFSKDMADIAGKIDLSLNDNQKTLSIVSVNKKTSQEVLTANLAVNWSRYLKVLVIDLNFGSEVFKSVFTVKSESAKMSDLLSAQKSVNLSAVGKTQFENLNFIPAGQVIDNVNLRLQSKFFSDMLTELKVEFDRIILNGIMTDNLNDQLVALKISDANVVVVSKTSAKKKQISKLATNMHDLNIESLGAVYIY